MTPAVALFLKAPRAGTVKTRLAAEIGDAAALELYRRMAGLALAAVRETGFDATVWYAPADARDEMVGWLGAECRYEPQVDGDLGARLAGSAGRATPGSVWIAIGGDCPRLVAAHLSAAAESLEHSEVVLGPTDDGGYYLIGGRVPLPGLFTGMPWSTAAVLDQTRARLIALGLRWHELPALRDVDTAPDARAEGLLP